MKIYLITDTHFGHDKMIEYCGRPVGFEDLILKNLRIVNDHDILIHLGDFCIGKDAEWHERFMELPGKKWLLIGNHDNKSKAWYLDKGWDFVAERFDYVFEGKKIAFSHIPLKDDDDFDLNIHGHFHNTLHRLLKGEYLDESEKARNMVDIANITEKHKLLSIEEENYKPILLSNFIKQP